MSVQTGIPPRELLALDGDWFDAIVTAADERWPLELELAATGLEVAHAHLLAFLRVHSKESARLPEPLRVERPGQEKPKRDGPAPVSVAELARLPGLTAELREVK